MPAVLAISLGLTLFAGCGGGDLIAEATAKADGACECDNFECTTDFIAWFNNCLLYTSDAADE